MPLFVLSCLTKQSKTSVMFGSIGRSSVSVLFFLKQTLMVSLLCKWKLCLVYPLFSLNNSTNPFLYTYIARKHHIHKSRLNTLNTF